MQYNTQQPHLKLPEYGRHIQDMVNYCKTIPDFEERTACAYAIVNTMAVLFPEEDTEENRKNFWDHLNIMANFELDVDFPCEVVHEEILNTRPDTVRYQNNYISYRHYGSTLERLINKAAEMEPGEERDALILLLANHMKKMMLAVNRDGVDDEKIFKDLAEISHGGIMIDPSAVRLHEFKNAPQPATKKRKRK